MLNTRKRFSSNGYINNCKGSLSVETSLTFPVLVSFLAVLFFFIRLASINITLNHAVHETARQIATSCYPVTQLNELEDEIISENDNVLNAVKREIGKNIDTGFQQARDEYLEPLAKILSGSVTLQDLDNLIGRFGVDILTTGLETILYEEITNKYFELKTHAEYFAVKTLLNEHIKDSPVNPDKIAITFFGFPKSQSEFEILNNSSVYLQKCSEIGYIPQKDEVIIVVEYRTGLNIPFFPTKEIKIIKTAVERAWLKGSYGVYAKMDSAIKDDDGHVDKGENDKGNERDNPEHPDDRYNNEQDDNEHDEDEQEEDGYFYITRTGKRYHKNGCMYLSKSKIPVKKSKAEESGYTPCKICIGGKKLFE